MSNYAFYPALKDTIEAKWIAPNGADTQKNLYFRARKEINVETVSDKVFLHIAAESYYILYVNGKLVGQGPARGTHENNYFDTYDIAPLLHPEKNFIAVMCLCMNIDTFVAAPAEPGLIVEVENIASSDSSWEVQIAEDWRKDVMLYTFQTGFSEWRDLSKEPAGWLEFEDKTIWEKAVEIVSDRDICKKRLLPRDILGLVESVYFPVSIPVSAKVQALENPDSREVAKNMTEESHLPLSHHVMEQLAVLCGTGEKTVVISPLEGNSGLAIVFNFAREIIGRFELDISAPAGTIIDICHEEELWNDRLRADHSNETYNFADRYILGQGRQMVGNSLLERGFRMVQIVIRNFKSPVIIYNIRSIDARYPFVRNGSFSCSDPLLNRIWDVCCETLSACATDVFIDCPWRERAFWVNDLIVENRTALQAFGDGRINMRAFRLAFSERNTVGLLPGVCPAPQTPDRPTFLSTNLYMTQTLKDYYYYTGDIQTVKELLPEMLKIIELFTSWLDECGLICPPPEYCNFFDWSYNFDERDYNGRVTSMINFLYISALKNCIELGDFAGTEIEKDKFLKLIKKVKAATEKYLFHEKRFADCIEDDGSCGKSSQLAHALAILSGEHLEDIAFDGLTDPDLLTPELYFQFFMFQALAEVNRDDEILNRIRKYWGSMIAAGTPTLWEAGIHAKGKKAFDGSGSLCHGFGAAPVDFFQRSILGVSPVAPGFKAFKVAPKPLGLDFAKGRVPTPEGNIHISWKLQNNVLDVTLKIPKGLTAVTASGEFGEGEHSFKLNVK